MPETLVVDCSVAAKWVLPEPGRAAAMLLLEQHESGELSLIAPDLLLAEFASLLAKRTRRKQIHSQQAREAFQLMVRCAPKLFDTRHMLPATLELALRYQISLWDCVYLALAVERGCPVITADRRLFRARTDHQPTVRLLE